MCIRDSYFWVPFVSRFLPAISIFLRAYTSYATVPSPCCLFMRCLNSNSRNRKRSITCLSLYSHLGSRSCSAFSFKYHGLVIAVNVRLVLRNLPDIKFHFHYEKSVFAVRQTNNSSGWHRAKSLPIKSTCSSFAQAQKPSNDGNLILRVFVSLTGGQERETRRWSRAKRNGRVQMQVNCEVQM